MPQTLPPPRLDSLDGIARSVARAQEAAAFADSLVPSNPAQAQELALAAKDHCTAALAALESIGATMPGIETDAAAVPSSVPLHLLDTVSVRRLLAALELAAAAGAEVDRERGWIGSDGEPCGWGEQIGAMVLQLRTEVHGPAGRD